MTSPTTYTIAPDSFYLTNGTLNYTGSECTSITVDNSLTYCIRIKGEIRKYSVDSSLINFQIPETALHGEGQQRVVDIGQRAETIEIRGYLRHTVEGTTNESAKDKELNLRKLAKQSENGMYLVWSTGSEQEIWGTGENNKVFIKKLEITYNADNLFALSDYYDGAKIVKARKPSRSVNMVLLIGKNTFVKS